MSVIAITSSRTSPGATTLAAGLAIAWSHQCERSLLVEADPSGGVLSLRFDLAAAPTLSTFGSDIRNGYSPDLVWSNTQDMRGVQCMPAPVDPRLARSWIERVSPALIESLPSLGAPTVIDLGWVGEDGESLDLARAADTTLVVTTPHTAEVQALLFQIRQLKAAGANVALVVVGDRPNDPQEIADLAGVPLAAVLPDDRAIAAALSGAKFSPKKFRRSLLWRTMSGLAASLLDEQLMLQRNFDAAPASAPIGDIAPDETEEPPAPGVATFEASQATPVPPVTSGNVVAIFDGTEADADGAPLALVPESDVEIAALTSVTGPARAEGLGPEPTVHMPRVLVLATGEQHVLTAGDPITIGRGSGCDVVIRDAEISRQHGTLTFTDYGWTYADNGSRNGSFINGERSMESVLTVNDEIVLGQTRLAFTSLGLAASGM